ncbi:CRE-SPE-8 protein [Caenorhabditis remanei]|uniref:Tyrosine-protein kinase n=1 Tax=Caenorhabditis remanei TaxID=31234 RepID=E3LX99_CAERE|nr:CRE-SPE-8 protein [Caenorhabditis remanei]
MSSKRSKKELQPESTQSDDKDPSTNTAKSEETKTGETIQERNVALDNLAKTPIQLIVQPTPVTPAITPGKPLTPGILNKAESETKNDELKTPKPREQLVEVPSDEVGRVENNIDNIPFYHGFMGRTECEAMLSNHGDFLIRMTEIGKRIAYVISIRWHYQNVHILVKRTKTKKLYWTKKYAFKSVCELIAYHKLNHKPIYENMTLVCGLARHGWQLNNEQVTFNKKLGEGQFGEVHKGQLKTSVFTSPVTVAVKTLHQNHLSANEKILFLKEANVMLTLSHPNVIKFYGVCTMKEPIMIVMEFCDGSSLEDVLLSKESKVPPEDKILYLFHAACGIDYLHGRHVIHRDIAARNCLLNSKKILKISDFGLSVKGVAIKERKGGCLPVKYMAPETLKKGLYSTSSDVYSYGALIYEVYTDGKTPFESCGLRGNELRKAIISKTVQLTIDVEVPTFIQAIFDQSRQYDTDERISSRRIIEIFKEESGVHEIDPNGIFHRFTHIGDVFTKIRNREREAVEVSN